MATTSQVTSYRAAGQPDDGVGAVGDICWDTANRITWVKQSNNSWVNGAYSNIGPTGPAQLAGSGPPASGLGQNGNGYTDQVAGTTYLKSNNAWSQVGSILGPQGLTGTTLMTNLATSPGPAGAYNNVALSSTPYVVPFPGSTQAAIFAPPTSSALMGVYAYSSVACTLTLYNVTASSPVINLSIGANASIGNQNYTAQQYPLIAGNVYQWQVTGNATGNLNLMPFYLTPSNTNAPAIGITSPAGFSTAQTFNSTATRLPLYGSAAGANTWSYVPPRAGGVYTAQATYTPAGGTTSSSSAQLTLIYAPLSGSGGGATNLSISAVTANGLPQTIITPRLTDQSSTFATGYYFYWTVTGSGTGLLSVTLFPIV